jgi:S1-C subfamily serine protease
LGQDTGLLIASVEADSPAEQGGLLLGDTIVALAGVPVHMHDDLISMLHGDRVGQATSIRVLRGGALQDIEVVIGERT